MIAECYMETRDYPPAAEYYAEAFSLAPEKYPEAPYKEGKCVSKMVITKRPLNAFSIISKIIAGKTRK
jgi:hypothetical protein